MQLALDNKEMGWLEALNTYKLNYRIIFTIPIVQGRSYEVSKPVVQQADGKDQE